MRCDSAVHVPRAGNEAHCARLTLDEFETFKLTADTLSVPRFYGLRHWECEDCTTHGDDVAVEFKGTLKPHQVEALEAVARYDRDGRAPAPNGRTLCLPCGRGKTVCALHWICAQKKRALVLVHKEFLAAQWEGAIAAFTTAATGRIQRDTVRLGEITVAMIQSLCVRDYDTSMFGTLVIDEAHHICARQFSQVMSKLACTNVLALTATPERKDGFTPLLFWLAGGIAYRGARDDGHVTVHIHEYTAHRVRERVGADGKVAMASMVSDLVRDQVRTKVVCDLITQRLAEGHCVIVLSERLAQLKDISKAVGGSFYVGSTKETDRRTAETNARLILSTYHMAAEGLDIPRLSALILATPRGDVVQSVGRVQRPADKLPPVVDDLVDPYSIFSGLRYKRLGFYRRSGFVVE